jgi:hypothetical protein
MGKEIDVLEDKGTSGCDALTIGGLDWPILLVIFGHKSFENDIFCLTILKLKFSVNVWSYIMYR